jgi:hypothetical protein
MCDLSSVLGRAKGNTFALLAGYFNYRITEILKCAENS